jgi:hypothetical protein
MRSEKSADLLKLARALAASAEGARSPSSSPPSRLLASTVALDRGDRCADRSAARDRSVLDRVTLWARLWTHLALRRYRQHYQHVSRSCVGWVWVRRRPSGLMAFGLGDPRRWRSADERRALLLRAIDPGVPSVFGCERPRPPKMKSRRGPSHSDAGCTFFKHPDRIFLTWGRRARRPRLRHTARRSCGVISAMIGVFGDGASRAMVINGAARGGDRRPRRLRQRPAIRAMRRIFLVHGLALIRRSLLLARDRQAHLVGPNGRACGERSATYRLRTRPALEGRAIR